MEAITLEQLFMRGQILTAVLAVLAISFFIYVDRSERKKKNHHK